MKYIASLIAISIATSASADVAPTHHNDSSTGEIGSHNGSNATSTSRASASSNSASSVDRSGNSSSVSRGGASSASTGAISNTLGGATSSSAGQSNAGNNSTVSIREDAQRRNPVSTAFAPSLSFGSDVCYVSASAGGQGITIGLSASVPFKDRDCSRRANARALQQLGETEAAVLYLSQDDDIAKAVTSARVNHSTQP